MRDQERDAAWRDWLDGRPKAVREIAERFPPWVPLRIKSTGQKAHIYSFGEREGGTICLQVTVRAEENPDTPLSIMMPEGHRVFGLSPDDVEPWSASHTPTPEPPQ